MNSASSSALSLHMIRSSQDKWTPLMYAVKEDHIEVVKLLLAQRSLDILAVNGVSLFSTDDW